MENKFKVTEKAIEEAIVQEIFVPLGNKTMICLLVLGTEEEVCGSYSVIDTENIDVFESKKLAREDAKSKVARCLTSIYQWQKTGEERAQAMKEAKEKQTKSEK